MVELRYIGGEERVCIWYVNGMWYSDEYLSFYLLTIIHIMRDTTPKKKCEITESNTTVQKTEYLFRVDHSHRNASSSLES